MPRGRGARLESDQAILSWSKKETSRDGTRVKANWQPSIPPREDRVSSTGRKDYKWEDVSDSSSNGGRVGQRRMSKKWEKFNAVT